MAIPGTATAATAMVNSNDSNSNRHDMEQKSYTVASFFLCSFLATWRKSATTTSSYSPA